MLNGTKTAYVYECSRCRGKGLGMEQCAFLKRISLIMKLVKFVTFAALQTDEYVLRSNFSVAITLGQIRQLHRAPRFWELPPRERKNLKIFAKQLFKEFDMLAIKPFIFSVNTFATKFLKFKFEFST